MSYILEYAGKLANNCQLQGLTRPYVKPKNFKMKNDLMYTQKGINSIIN